MLRAKLKFNVNCFRWPNVTWTEQRSSEILMLFQAPIWKATLLLFAITWQYRNNHNDSIHIWCDFYNACTKLTGLKKKSAKMCKNVLPNNSNKSIIIIISNVLTLWLGSQTTSHGSNVSYCFETIDSVPRKYYKASPKWESHSFLFLNFWNSQN